jgi:hypothetical protein
MSESRVSFADDSDRAASTAEALRILRRDGVVVLDDLIDLQLIERCRGELEAAYPDMARPNRELNYGPYEGRHCTPVVVDQTLADPALLLPQPVSSIARTLLEEPYKVDSVGLLVAAPGAPDQIAHHDGWLFPREGLDRLLPPFALAFSVPLVPMDETSGRTAFWLRSHRSASPTPEGPFDFAPTVNPGSAILWDFRVLHCGMANRGERPRPVIFTVLSREWWVEVQPPEATLYRKLRLSREVHSGFRPRWKARFSRAELVDAGE